jgi:hypothetical protein
MENMNCDGEFFTQLNDFNCDYNNLKTEMLIMNPSIEVVIEKNDKILMLGTIPVSES